MRKLVDRYLLDYLVGTAVLSKVTYINAVETDHDALNEMNASVVLVDEYDFLSERAFYEIVPLWTHADCRMIAIGTPGGNGAGPFVIGDDVVFNPVDGSDNRL